MGLQLDALGVLDPGGVRSLVEGGTQRRHGKLWLLLNLEAWYRRWIRGERAAKAPDPTVPSAVHGSRI